MSTKSIVARLRKRVSDLLEPGVPVRLRARHRVAEPGRLAGLESSLRAYCGADRAADYLDTERGRQDLDEQLTVRLDSFRQGVIPWLDDARALESMRVLEVGCGTGSSTVALAEQGAVVTGIDTDTTSLRVAEERCRAYGVSANLHAANATELTSCFEPGAFDLVIFFASLEHMIHQERLEAMRQAWALLGSGGLWCVAQAPNRLWHQDDHTSRLPFFMWLPDDLAFDYSRFSPRESFREIYRHRDPESMLHFLRRGRGVSFHEFDLALGPAENLRVVSSLARFRNRNLLRSGLSRASRASRHRRFLARSAGRQLDGGFFEPYLYLILEKD